MENLLYIIAIVLCIGWVIAYLIMDAGGVMHLMLLAADLVLILQLYRGNKTAIK